MDRNFSLTSYLVAGTTYYYQATSYNGSAAIYKAELSATDVVDLELLETAYSTTAPSGSELWFSYTPSVDGEFYFVSSYTSDADAASMSEDLLYSIGYIEYINFNTGDTTSIYTLPEYDDEEDEYVTAELDGVSYNVYSLTAGTTYYIHYYYSCYEYIYNETTESYDYNSYDGTITMAAYQVNHTHTYADKNITWTWSDDYSSATAVLRCDACADTVDLIASVTSTTGDSSIVYTATASYNDVEYTDTVEVALSDDDSEDGSEDTSKSESTDNTDSEDSDSEDANSEDTDSADSGSDDTDSEDSGSDAATTTLAETTITSTTAWSAITTSALTVSGDSTTTYTVTIDEAYGDDWFSVEVYDGDGNYITLNSDGTYWYYGTEGDDIVMTGSAITLEEGATYTVEIIRDGSDFTVTFYDEEGNELLSYYAANTNIDETAATHVYAQIGSYTVSGEATGTAASLDDTTDENNGETTDNGASDGSGDSSASTTNSVITTGSSTVSGSPKTGDAGLLLFALLAAFGCMVTAISCKKKFLG